MRDLLIKIGIAIASVAMTIALAELVLGIAAPQDRSLWAHTRDGLVIHPASFETYLPQFDRRVRTNAWGMRDRPHEREKPDGTFRILVLGDSFMEALQVDFEDSLPSLLEAELSERTGRTVEVVNGSTSGWGTDDELTYLDRYGMRFEPDLVLVAMTLHNDVLDNLDLEHHDLRDGRIVERPRRESGWWSWTYVRLRDFIASRSHLYNVYRRFKMIRASQNGARRLDAHLATLILRETDPRTAEGWEMTRQLLDETHRVAGEGGAETAVFLLPLLIQVSDENLERFLTARGIQPQEIELERPQETVERWGEKAHVEVIDLLPEFRAATRNGSTLFLAGDGHWNREGHALAADVVARELIARGLVAAETASSR